MYREQDIKEVKRNKTTKLPMELLMRILDYLTVQRSCKRQVNFTE